MQDVWPPCALQYNAVFPALSKVCKKIYKTNYYTHIYAAIGLFQATFHVHSQTLRWQYIPLEKLYFLFWRRHALAFL